jgi:hypothetical protein
MFTVEIRHENGDGKEFGYGVYVNAYVSFDEFEDDIPLLYASECVPFGQNDEQHLKAAERRVRRNAERKVKREYMA